VAFTSALGTIDSRLSNIILGQATQVGQIYDNSVTLNVTSSSAESFTLIATPAVTLTATDSLTALVGLVATLSITVSATDAFNADNGQYFDIVSASVTSALTSSGNLLIDSGITISSTDSFSIGVIGVATVIIPLSVTASLTSTPGSAFFDFAQALATSSIGMLPGIGYSDTLTLNGTSATLEFMIGANNLTVELDVTSSTGLSTQVDWRPSEVITGVSSATVTHIGDWQQQFQLNVIDILYPEGYYNYVQAFGFSRFDETYNGNPLTNTEQPEAVSGFGVTATIVFNRSVGQTITYTQVAHTVPLPQRVNQMLAIVQAATSKSIHNTIISQTLAFSQIAYRVYAVVQTLIITSQATATRVHVQSVTQTFVPSQTATKTSSVSRTSVNTFVMSQGRTMSLPLLGRMQQSVSVPAVYAAVVKQKCFVTLGVPARTIVLPCPQLGDSQTYSGTLNLKRSMTGDTITYVKRSRFNHLKYSWWLGRQKGLELEDFVFNFSDQFITLYNWKGETWVGYITSNPFDFVAKERYQPTGERIEVTLDFEVVKVGG
jgi:hypothetical protein